MSKPTESDPQRNASLAPRARNPGDPVSPTTQSSSDLQGTTRAKTGSPSRTARLDSALARSSEETGLAAALAGGAFIRYKPALVATIISLPSLVQPTRLGEPESFGSRSSRSAPFSRFMTQTVAGVESRSDFPLRKATAPPSGETAGL